MIYSKTTLCGRDKSGRCVGIPKLPDAYTVHFLFADSAPSTAVAVDTVPGGSKKFFTLDNFYNLPIHDTPIALSVDILQKPSISFTSRLRTCIDEYVCPDTQFDAGTYDEADDDLWMGLALSGSIIPYARTSYDSEYENVNTKLPDFTPDKARPYPPIMEIPITDTMRDDPPSYNIISIPYPLLPLDTWAFEDGVWQYDPNINFCSIDKLIMALNLETACKTLYLKLVRGTPIVYGDNAKLEQCVYRLYSDNEGSGYNKAIININGEDVPVSLVVDGATELVAPFSVYMNVRYNDAGKLEASLSGTPGKDSVHIGGVRYIDGDLSDTSTGDIPDVCSCASGQYCNPPKKSYKMYQIYQYNCPDPLTLPMIPIVPIISDIVSGPICTNYTITHVSGQVFKFGTDTPDICKYRITGEPVITVNGKNIVASNSISDLVEAPFELYMNLYVSESGDVNCVMSTSKEGSVSIMLASVGLQVHSGDNTTGDPGYSMYVLREYICDTAIELIRLPEGFMYSLGADAATTIPYKVYPYCIM